MKNFKKTEVFLCLLTLLPFVSCISFAQNTGAAFLKIVPNARSVGMGSAFTAISNDASAVYWNPSCIAGIRQKQLMFTHSEWIAGMNYEFASFIKSGPDGGMGLGVTYLAQGNFEGRDENRNPTSGFSAYDLAVSLAVSRKLFWGDVGITTKIINQKIESEKALGIGFDLGYKVQKFKSPFSLGLTIKNIGPKMKFIEEGYYLPLTITAGIGYKIADALSLAFDVQKRIYTGSTSINIGTEYWVLNKVALRMGYLSKMIAFTQTNSNNNSRDIESKTENSSGLGAGLGVKIASYQIDYAFTPYKELGNAHRITLSAGF